MLERFSKKHIRTEFDEELAWLELDEIPEKVYNPLMDFIPGQISDPVDEFIKICINPDYLSFVCKYILNIELPPYQAVILDVLWNKRLPLLIGTRGAAKSFTLAVYSLLRMLLEPGCRIVIAGAGLRHARNVFDYMANIWDNAPVLRDIAGGGRTAGPHREVDRYQFELGDSRCWGIPIGSGEKIRGLRANYILAEEFSCLQAKTLIETNKGLMRIGDCENIPDLKLYTGRDNKLEAPTKFIKTPLTDVYKIETTYSMGFKCSGIHKVMTDKGWKLAKDLTKDDYLIYENHYEFPKQMVEKNGIIVDENVGWIMGILIAEGSINAKHYFSVHMIDKVCLAEVERRWNEIDKNLNVCKYVKEAYIDDRGWDCKESYTYNVCNLKLREKFVELGLDRSVAINKKIPWCILQSPREVMLSFLSALFWGDGSCFLWKDKGKNKLGISYYSISETLIDELQTILLKFNIFAAKVVKPNPMSENTQWMLRINGQYAHRLYELLNIEKWKNIIDGCDHWESRKVGVSFHKKRQEWVASYYQKGHSRRIGGFKTKEEAQLALKNSKKAAEILLKVKLVTKLEEKEHLYDFYLPDTNSFYGNGFNQHNSQNEEVFNTVVQGFAVVSQNPMEKIKNAAVIKNLKKLGHWSDELEKANIARIGGNQIVYSGTAFYSFNHFYKYFVKWHTIIKAKGDQKKLQDILGTDSVIEKGFNWKDYAIIRLPYTHVPEGLLDQGIIVQARATLSRGQFLMEYGAVFQTDSDGFFKRSIIEGATTNKPVSINGKLVQFSTLKEGSPNKVYIIGVDPAADADNAAIVVIEINDGYRSIVHCWTTNKKKHNELKKLKAKEGIEVSDDYYRYIARKIRSLMKLFNIERIMMDKNGGGTAIAESLKDRKDCTEFGDIPVYEIIDQEKLKSDDQEKGAHILELLAPNQDLNRDANHGMLKDFQEKVLLFPLFDSIEVAKSVEMDSRNNIKFDTYEDLVMEIEDLKDEITSIVVKPSAFLGKETFDVPSNKVEGSKRGHQRKDRYSALLYANYYARNKGKEEPLIIQYKATGRSTKDNGVYSSTNSGQMYCGLGAAGFKTDEGYLSKKHYTYVKHGNRHNR